MSAERAALQRRTLRVLLVSQLLAGAGLAAGITVGALLAKDMLGSTGTSGVPAALFTLGSASAAALVGRLSQRSGRRLGLAAGYGIGALGGAGVVAAAAIGSVALLFASLVLYGAGSATNLQARYAGADLAPDGRRGRAISTVLVATTVGAVLGPNLVEPAGRLAAAFGIRTLAGPFMLATAAYALAALAVYVQMRPDPLLTARRLALSEPAGGGAPAEPAAQARTLRLAAAAMVLTQLVMVAIMTMTPVHMRAHGHSLAVAGFVISVHIAGMYMPSLVSGALVDRFGRRRVLAAGAVTLIFAGGLAAAAPEDSVALLTIALGLLGVGWNLGLVAGTAMVTDAAPIATRARTQGGVDLAVSLAGASGGLSSGFVVATAGYATLSLAGGLLAFALLPVLLLARPSGQAFHAAAAPEPASTTGGSR